MKKRIILILLLALITALIVWSMRPQPIHVSLITVARGDLVETVVNTRAGTITSCQRARLALPLGGVIEKLFVTEGDNVKQGEPLLFLWNKDLQAVREQAAATVTLTEQLKAQSCTQARFDRRESDRLQPLKKKSLASENSADSAETRASVSRLACEAKETELQIAQHQLALADARLEQTKLFAPFDGIVAEVNGELGEYLTPSPQGVATLPAVDLIDDRCLYVSAPIDEVDAAKVRVGQSTKILLDALPEQKLIGTIRRIAPYVLDLEKQARTVAVEADLTSPPADLHLLIGYSADLEIEINRHNNVVRIPGEALTQDGKLYLFENQQLTEITPELGLSNWSWQEIISGVSEGQKIVKNPGQLDYQPGMQVIADD